MDKSLVQVQEYSLEGRVAPAQLQLFARVGDLDMPAPTQDFDVLIEVLSIQTHQVGRLVLL